jgi:hypothetical protein
MFTRKKMLGKFSFEIFLMKRPGGGGEGGKEKL